eukprot:m51a1_g8367 hypothetical protein (737) ;mRNA; r:140275-143392
MGTPTQERLLRALDDAAASLPRGFAFSAPVDQNSRASAPAPAPVPAPQPPQPPQATDAFLRDHVRRLEDELARYQHSGAVPGPAGPVQAERWSADESLAAPLLRAYDERVASAEAAAEAARAQAEEAEQRLAQLAEENERTVEQLREVTEPWRDVTGEDGNSVEIPTVHQREMSESIKELEKDNEEFVKENEALLAENEQLKKSIRSLRSEADEIPRLHDQIKSMQNEIQQKNARIIEQENVRQSMEVQLGQMKTAVDAAAQMKTDMEAALARADSVSRENADIAAREHSLSIRHKSVQRELRLVASDRDRLDEQVAALEAQLEESVAHEAEATQSATEAAEQFEDLRRARDQAAQREQLAATETRRVADRMATELQRAKELAAEELATVRKQFEAQVARLNADVQELQASSASLSAELERRKREKRSLELELDNSAQRSESEVTRASKAGLLEKDTLNVQVLELQQRAARSDQLLALSKEERARMQLRLDELESENRSLQEARAAAERRQGSELQILRRDYETQLRHLEERLAQSDAARLKSAEDIKSLTASHNAMVDKWKEEARAGAVRLQKLSKEQQAKITQLSARNDDLTARLAQTAQQLGAATKAKEEAARTVERLRQDSQALDQRLADSELREQEQRQREQILVQENVALLAEVDKTSVDRERVARELSTCRAQLQQTSGRRPSCQCETLSLRLDQASRTIERLENTNQKLREERRQVLLRLRSGAQEDA